MDNNVQTDHDNTLAGRVIALYFRVSTDQQQTERQKKALRETAAALFPTHGIEEFPDDGVSAFKLPIDARPEGSKLCALIATGRVAAVLADAQDRLTRHGDLDWIAFRELCRANDTRIVIDGSELTDDMGGKMLGYLRNILAHEESVEKSHRVRSGLDSLRKDGYWPHGKAPFGYEATGEKRHRVLAPNKDAKLVTRAFELFAEGESIAKVAAFLTGATGRTVGRHSAKYLLANPAYLGLIPEGTYKPGRGRKIATTHPGKHPAVVSEELFRRVADRLDRYTRERERQSDVHPFGAIARCGCCDHSLRFKPVSRPSGTPDIYLQCENPRCGKLRIPLEHFETGLLFSLAAVRLNLHMRLDDPTWAVAYPDTETQETLSKELAKIRAEIDKVWIRESDGTISEATAERLLTSLTEREKHTEAAVNASRDNGGHLRANIAELRDQLDSLAKEYGAVSEEEGGVLGFWLTASVQERRRYLASILQRVEVHPADETRETPKGMPYSLTQPHIRLDFHAGIDFKLPVLLKKDPVITPALRAIGCGRKVTLAR